MTDAEWHKKVKKLYPKWLRRGCADMELVNAIFREGRTRACANVIHHIAADIERDPLGLYWRPLWYRRWRNKWGERMTKP